MYLFLLVLRDGPCGGFREHGVLCRKDGKKGCAVLHKYYENDYLCYVRVVTDADEEVLEHNDYLEPLTLTMEQGSIRQRQDDGLQWIRWQRSTTAYHRTPSATTIR